MRRISQFVAILICSLLLTGCFIQRDRAKWELPSEPVCFEDRDSEDYDMRVLTVRGRDYMPFGTVKTRVNDSSVRECLGYLNGDKGTRVYTLEEDGLDNYIMIRNVEGIMEQPDFWRAADTMGENIDTPDYIESLGYEEWSTSGIFSDDEDIWIAMDIEADDIESIRIDYDIDGRPAGEMETGGSAIAEIKRGNDHSFFLRVGDSCDRAYMGEPFPISVRFTVTDRMGKVHEADGRFVGNIVLGEMYRVTLTGDADNGYKIK